MVDVLLVADNPGAIDALAPVRAHLATRASVVFAASSSTADMPLSDSPADVFARLDPALLVSGTGTRGSWDKRYLVEAAVRGVTSLAIVDFWSNYEARLIASDGRQLRPDWVAVPDAVAAEHMAATGVPRDRILAVGMTRFDGLPPASKNALKIASAKRRLRIEEERPLVLVLSQPIAETTGGGDEARAVYGYDEGDALAVIEDAISRLGARFQTVLKLHPRDLDRDRLSNCVRTVPGGEPLAPWLAAADVVIGITTSALIDAYREGIPTISVQPGHGGYDPLPLTRDRLVPCARTAAELEREIVGALAAGPRTTPQHLPEWMDGKAPHRVAKLVDGLLSRTRSMRPKGKMLP
jgi:hypothetical protein